jgi:hypothetical protein
MARKKTNAGKTGSPGPQAPRPRGRPRSAVPKPRAPIRITIRSHDPWINALDRLAVLIANRPGEKPPGRTEVLDQGAALLARQYGMEMPGRYDLESVIAEPKKGKSGKGKPRGHP